MWTWFICYCEWKYYFFSDFWMMDLEYLTLHVSLVQNEFSQFLQIFIWCQCRNIFFLFPIDMYLFWVMLDKWNPMCCVAYYFLKLASAVLHVLLSWTFPPGEGYLPRTQLIEICYLFGIIFLDVRVLCFQYMGVDNQSFGT